MTKYKVQFISKDGHLFIFNTEAKAEMNAIAQGEAKIQENGWEHYLYTFDVIAKV